MADIQAIQTPLQNPHMQEHNSLFPALKYDGSKTGVLLKYLNLNAGIGAVPTVDQLNAYLQAGRAVFYDESVNEVGNEDCPEAKYMLLEVPVTDRRTVDQQFLCICIIKMGGNWTAGQVGTKASLLDKCRQFHEEKIRQKETEADLFIKASNGDINAQIQLRELDRKALERQIISDKAVEDLFSEAVMPSCGPDVVKSTIIQQVQILEKMIKDNGRTVTKSPYSINKAGTDVLFNSGLVSMLSLKPIILAGKLVITDGILHINGVKTLKGETDLKNRGFRHENIEDLTMLGADAVLPRFETIDFDATDSIRHCYDRRYRMKGIDSEMLTLSEFCSKLKESISLSLAMEAVTPGFVVPFYFIEQCTTQWFMPLYIDGGAHLEAPVAAIIVGKDQAGTTAPRTILELDKAYKNSLMCQKYIRNVWMKGLSDPEPEPLQLEAVA